MADKVQVELEVLAKKALDSVEEFARSAQKSLSSISLSATVTGINQGFELVEKTVGRAFEAIKGFAEEAVKEAVLAEEAQTNLNNALRLSGDYSLEAAKGFDEFAKSLQRTTKFSDEQVLNSVALAKQFGLTNAEAKRAVSVAVDLAAALGEDLSSATFKVGQTFNGFVNRDLAKIAPELRNLSKGALVAGDALNSIERRVRGSAEALAGNFSGAIAQAKNAFSDLQETIGGFVTQNPQIIAIIKEVRNSFDELNAALAKNGDSIRSLLADAFILFIQAVPLVAKGIQNITTNFTAASFYVQKFATILGAIGAAIVNFNDTQAQVAIGKALKEDLEALDEQFGKTLNAQEDLFQPFIKSATDLAARVATAKESVKTFGSEVQKSLSGRKNREISVFGPVEEQLRLVLDAQNKIRDNARQAVESVTKAPLEGVIRFAITGQNELTKTINQIDGVIRELKTANISEELRQQATAFADEMKRKLRELNKASIGAGILNNILKGAEGAQKLVSGAIGAAADAILPGIGGVVSEIVDVLGQGPDKVREMVTQFAKSLPQIVDNIIKALPVLIEALARELPPALAKTMPLVAQRFAIELVRNMPTIIRGFAEGLVEAAKQFVQTIIDTIKSVGGIFDGGGIFGGGGGNGGLLSGSGIPVISQIGDFLGLADGGRIPDLPQYEGDRFPARLNAGEQVLSKDLSSKLDAFLAGSGQGPQVVQITIGQREMARVLLDLNRNGFRTA